MIMQSIRRYSTHVNTVKADRLGTATAVAYWLTVVSAPFAGAYAISQAAAKDKRSQTWYASIVEEFIASMLTFGIIRRPLSFRDCLPGSSLDDYAGAYMRLRR